MNYIIKIYKKLTYSFKLYKTLFIILKKNHRIVISLYKNSFRNVFCECHRHNIFSLKLRISF
ncbi:hypothetical protein V1477_009077 [Vespula maculifrons]|uniref:Uncharacterized protein n=1 Tax=Vespula maculifrons TaxID=7453 RepID=A0ABD2CEU4_VESMC